MLAAARTLAVHFGIGDVTSNGGRGDEEAVSILGLFSKYVIQHRYRVSSIDVISGYRHHSGCCERFLRFVV